MSEITEYIAILNHARQLQIEYACMWWRHKGNLAKNKCFNMSSRVYHAQTQYYWSHIFIDRKSKSIKSDSFFEEKMLVNYLFVLCLFCMYFYSMYIRTKKVSCFLCPFDESQNRKLCACEKRDSPVHSFVFFRHEIRSGVTTVGSLGWAKQDLWGLGAES